MNNTLNLFKEKYQVDDYFTNEIKELLDKLLDFGYISKLKYNSLLDKLFENINEIRLGNSSTLDYKTGYYDANKKELYIKDTKNIESVFLRLLYVLTTEEIDNNIYRSGYSTTKLRKDSYRLSYEGFGINRGIISGLVCKLCDSLPLNMQIIPTTRTYTHNFLGIEIESSSNIYSLEGKILNEMCYVLEIDPEVLYSGLFSKNPVHYLDSVFSRKKFIKKDEFMHLFDKLSMRYNTYNKLAFLSNKLNDNYIEYKKHVLNDNVDLVKKEEIQIEEYIKRIISKINGKDIDDEGFDSQLSLAETLENLENELKNDIINIQDILSENIISINKGLSYVKYASKLKSFSNILIVPNKMLNKEIHDTILYKLMPNSEVTGINLIQKIKYGIIQKILSEKDFLNISNSYSFYNITNFENHDTGSTLIILLSSKNIPKLVEVTGLDKKFSVSSDLKLNYIPLDNLKYAISSNYSNILISNVEKLFTDLKNNFEELDSIQLDNVYTFEYEKNKYILAYIGSKYYIISYKYASEGYVFSQLNLSENYKVFGKTIVSAPSSYSNLPTLYKK